MRSGGLLQLISQRAAQDFPDVGLGQLGAEVHVPWHLVSGHFGAAIGDQGLRGERRVLLDDEQGDYFA